MKISEITDTDIMAVSDVLISAYKDELWNENRTRERAIISIKNNLNFYKQNSMERDMADVLYKRLD